MCPTSNEGQPHPALYWLQCNQQGKKSYYSPLFGTSETTPGVMSPILNVPVKKKDQRNGGITCGLEPLVSMQ